MTKIILRAKKPNYTRFGCFIPEKETVITNLSEYFKKSGRSSDDLLNAFKSDSNIELRIKEDSISNHSTVSKAVLEDIKVNTDIKVEEKIKIKKPAKKG